MSKKTFIVLLCILAAILAVIGILFSLKATASGADTPEEALAGYEKASMLFNAGDMVRYSTDYNLFTLVDYDYSLSRGEIKKTLEGYYKNETSPYTEDGISFTLVEKSDVASGSEEYGALADELAKYNGETADSFAVVTLKVFSDGNYKFKYTGICAETNGKWYFFKSK